MNLKDKITELLNTPDLAPETRALLRATLEAQETGKIPTDLTRFMEPEPTPGEWYWKETLIGSRGPNIAPEGNLICRSPLPDRQSKSFDRWPANAPILAAAKDMRDALKRLDRPGGIFAQLEDDYDLEDAEISDIEFARAALAKAKKGGAE